MKPIRGDLKKMKYEGPWVLGTQVARNTMDSDTKLTRRQDVGDTPVTVPLEVHQTRCDPVTTASHNKDDRDGR